MARQMYISRQGFNHNLFILQSHSEHVKAERKFSLIEGEGLVMPQSPRKGLPLKSKSHVMSIKVSEWCIGEIETVS